MDSGTWAVAAPAVGAAFAASLVEVVEAFTIILAVATLRGWRPAAMGTLGALAVLGLSIVLLGPLLDRVPLHFLQLSIGVLLLVFGLGWLRKAVLRAAGVIPLHDEEAIFASETTRLLEAARQGTSLDWIAGLTAFKAVLLEGLEVVFIVLAVGAGRGLFVAGCRRSSCRMRDHSLHRGDHPPTASPNSRELAKIWSRGDAVCLRTFLDWRGSWCAVARAGSRPPNFRRAVSWRRRRNRIIRATETSGSVLVNIVGDVAKELLAMFLVDFRLTISVLILVATAAIFVDWLHINPLVGGGLLVIGTLLILVEAVAREAKRSVS